MQCYIFIVCEFYTGFPVFFWLSLFSFSFLPSFLFLPRAETLEIGFEERLVKSSRGRFVSRQNKRKEKNLTKQDKEEGFKKLVHVRDSLHNIFLREAIFIVKSLGWEMAPMRRRCMYLVYETPFPFFYLFASTPNTPPPPPPSHRKSI